MFHIKPQHVRRATLATRLFPKLSTTFGLDTSNLASLDQYDGEIFCGGRSKNKDLLLHLGFLADSQGSSTFIQMPLYRRSIKKLTNFVENDLENVGAHETHMPTLIPQDFWHQSDRLGRQEDALRHVYKLTDSNGKNFLLGPTYEESMTHLVGSITGMTNLNLPLLLYQTSNKFRFESNPKFGLIRNNEFLMNDLYSFDIDSNNAKETYNKICSVYDIIFKKLNLECHKIESLTGNIGGEYSHEYQMLVSSGEDSIIKCNDCHYSCNTELHIMTDPSCKTCTKCNGTDLIRSQALELGHTFLLGDTYSKPLNAKCLDHTTGRKVFYHMGCFGLGLSRILGAGLDLLSIVPTNKSDNKDEFIQLRWPDAIEPYKFGLVPPAKRSRQTQSGSTEFTQLLLTKILDSTRDCDIIVEDQLREGIGWRVKRLQSIGVPNIIVIGSRFLQHPPEIELLSLDRETNVYNQCWYTFDQLVDRIIRMEQAAD